MTWPIGSAATSAAYTTSPAIRIHCYTRPDMAIICTGYRRRSTGSIATEAREFLGTTTRRLREQIELVRGASHTFDRDALPATASLRRCSSARRSATSACAHMLDCFVECAPAPATARHARAHWLARTEEAFTGFVFKIQANMDPKHRDRIAFLRICSGRYRQGHEDAARADRQGQSRCGRGDVHGGRAGARRGSVSGRHHRPAQPRHHSDRRHLHRRRRICASWACRTSRRNCFAACACAIR